MFISCSKVTDNPSSSQNGDPSEGQVCPLCRALTLLGSAQIEHLEEIGHIVFVLNYELLHNYYS
jgi:hypothetical protein